MEHNQSQSLRDQAEKIYQRLYRKSYIDEDSKKIEITGSKATGARLYLSAYENLTDISAKENLTINFLINVAVRQFLENYKYHEQDQEKDQQKWLADFDEKTNDEKEKFLFEEKIKIADINLGI